MRVCHSLTKPKPSFVSIYEANVAKRRLLTNHDCSPDDDDCWEEDTGAELAKHDGCRGLQSNVCDEEQQYDDAVTLTSELKVGTHTSYHGDTQVGPVHQRDTVHESESGNQTKVNLADNLLLLLGSERIDASIVEF